MEPHSGVTLHTYIHDREYKQKAVADDPMFRYRSTTTTMSNDLTTVDPDLVKGFASIIESACVLIEGAPNDQPCPIHASVGEIRHFVHYMRQLDTEFRRASGLMSIKDSQIQALKQELSEIRRRRDEAEAQLRILAKRAK